MNKAVNKSLYKFVQLTWFLFGLIEIILLFRFLLRLLGANAGAAFTMFVYDVSAFFLAPFWFIVPSTQVQASVFEWFTLIAMLTYWVVAWIIVELIALAKPVSSKEAEHGIRHET